MWLAASVFVNLGVLGYFKYGGFLLENFVTLAASIGIDYQAPDWSIILPVGISFYTFQTMAYSLDVYLRRAEPSKSFLHFAFFVTFFPQLVAGPKVVRDQVAEEFRKEHKAVQQYAETLRDAGIDSTGLLIRGPTVDTVLLEAKRIEADLIIVGSHGYGALYDLLVGSESRGILKKSEIPVLVVPVKDG